jgi:pimeloyl-ACP methyl ester carboxylesterase
MSSTASDQPQAETIVLIHGMWMTPRSWDNWIDHYSDRGYRAIAPGWPGIDKEPEELRRDPSPLRGIGIAQVVDHYDRIIRGLDRPPIIIGHSFGALFMQLLLDRGLGAAGVALGTAPPKGVILLPPSTLRAGFPALKNPFNRNGLAPLTPKQFHWCFTNALSRDESDAVYQQHYIPGTNRAFFEDAFANLNPKSPAKIDFRNPSRPPLLLIVGGKDRISPPAVNRTVLKLQQRAPSVTERKDFPERCHYMAGQDGWEEVADYALNWALEHVWTAAPQRAKVGTPAKSS